MRQACIASARWSPLMVVLLTMGLLTAGETKYYQRGKVIALVVNDEVLPIGSSGTQSAPVVIGKEYQVRFRAEDFVYIANCWAKDLKYKVRWTSGTFIDFRVHKNMVFVRNQKGQDSQLALIVKLKSTDDNTDTKVVGPVSPFVSKSPVPQCR